MDLELFIIDAFADEPLSGNPAAVCPVESWPSDAMMQAIAQELNQSETVFFAPDGENYSIRWFTPTREVDHIGHATLAAGHLVLERMRQTAKSVKFDNPGGAMTVSRDGISLNLEMPSLQPHPLQNFEDVALALGSRPSRVLAAKHYLCVFDDEADVVGLEPDMAALARLDLPAVIATAPTGRDDADFVSRFFAPANGVPEDSVSGVAHCCLAPFWAGELGKSNLTGYQASQRGGLVRCRYDGETVTLGGTAAIFLEGRIQLPNAVPVR